MWNGMLESTYGVCVRCPQTFIKNLSLTVHLKRSDKQLHSCYRFFNSHVAKCMCMGQCWYMSPRILGMAGGILRITIKVNGI